MSNTQRLHPSPQHSSLDGEIGLVGGVILEGVLSKQLGFLSGL